MDSNMQNNKNQINSGANNRGVGYQGALGVEFGSQKMVMACFDTSGVDVILSETSDKSTPAIVAYTKSERIIGLAASNQRKRNQKNSLQYIHRFLGLTADCLE